VLFFFQAEDGIRDLVRSRGLGDVYKRQVITNQTYRALVGCDVYDINRLRDTGAIAGWLVDGKLTLVSVRDYTGDRLWNTQSVRRRDDSLRTFLAWSQDQ